MRTSIYALVFSYIAFAFIESTGTTQTCPDSANDRRQGNHDERAFTGSYVWNPWHTGYGRYMYLDDVSRYDGEWRQGKWEGTGTLTWPNGGKYVGAFRNDKREGTGTRTWPDGGKYVGEYRNDKREGTGTLTLPGGQKYVGEYRNDKREGTGTLTWPNGKKYVGDFKEGRMEGRGTYTWPDGRKYVGEVRNGKREGSGTLTWPNGSGYKGQWKNDVQHGRGLYRHMSGLDFEQEWENGWRTKWVLTNDSKFMVFIYGLILSILCTVPLTIGPILVVLICGSVSLVGAYFGPPAWSVFSTLCCIISVARTYNRMDGCTLATSNFLSAYRKAKPPDTMLTLGSKLGAVIRDHCAACDIPYDDNEGEKFFNELQKEMNDTDSTVEAVQRMWTSCQLLRGQEFCSILNRATRDDHEVRIAPVAALTRAINKLCVEEGRMPQGPFPDGDICYRGGGFNDSYRNFFVPGREFRQPAFLATSFLESTADNFMYRSTMPAKVKWLIRIDPLRKCIHVNLVRRRVPNLPDEKEYLFAPYSVFTVRSAQWNNGTNADPHIIELEAAHDNKEHSDKLPLAPWS